MSLKFINKRWRDDLKNQTFSGLRLEFNPRQKEWSAYTETALAWTENTKAENLPGTYRLTCTASTRLMYLFTMPTDYVISGYFKHTALSTDQYLFKTENAYLMYDGDGVDTYTDGTLSSDALALEGWNKFTYVFDTTNNVSQFKIWNTTTLVADETGTAAASVSNTLYIGSEASTGFTGDLSYFTITDITGVAADYDYFTYDPLKVHYVFPLNGLTLGQERIDISGARSDGRRLFRSYSLSKAKEDQLSGCAGSSRATFMLNNANGEFSDDQYAAFDQASEYFNGTSTQKYLQNRIQFYLSTLFDSGDGNPWAYWALNESLSDIPDNAAGALYVQDDWATTDSWAVTNGTLAVSGGELDITPNNAGATAVIYRTTGSCANKIVIVKITTFDTSKNLRAYDGAAYNNMTKIYESGNEQIWEYYFSAFTGTALYIYLVDGVLGNNWSINWVYIGTGARDTHPQDSSGNANHLVLYGGRTVAGGSGQGIYLPGLSCNYLRTANVLATVPDVWHFHCSLPDGNATPTENKYFFSYKNISATVGFFSVLRSSGSLDLLVRYTDGSASKIMYFSSFFDEYSSVRIDIDVSVDWITGAVSVYRNGVQFGTTQTMTTPVKPTAGSYLYIGAYVGNDWCLAGTIDEIFVFPCALSSAKMTEMYSYPARQLNCFHEHIAGIEPLYTGKCDASSFSRSSPNVHVGTVSVNCEDAVADLARAHYQTAKTFENYDLCDTANEGDSLLHSIVRLASRKYVYNYFGNSSFEGVIADNMTTNGTMTKEAGGVLGSNYAKLVTSGKFMKQNITFHGVEYLQKYDWISISFYAKAAAAVNVTFDIDELDAAVAGTTHASTIAFTTSWARQEVSIQITDAGTDNLDIMWTTTTADAIYVDAVQLTRSKTCPSFYVENTNEGTAGVCNADDYGSGYFESVAFDVESVDIEHPWVLIKKNTQIWSYVQQLADASIAKYLGFTPDGVLKFRSTYTTPNATEHTDTELRGTASATPTLMETMVGGVGVQLDGRVANKIKVQGVRYYKEPKGDGFGEAGVGLSVIFDMSNAGSFIQDSTGLIRHTVANGDYVVPIGNGTDEHIVCKYDGMD